MSTPELGKMTTEALQDAFKRVGFVPEVNPQEELERVGDLASNAIAALLDEREGDFRRDILELHTRAATLLHLVATW